MVSSHILLSSLVLPYECKIVKYIVKVLMLTVYRAYRKALRLNATSARRPIAELAARSPGLLALVQDQSS